MEQNSLQEEITWKNLNGIHHKSVFILFSRFHRKREPRVWLLYNGISRSDYAPRPHASLFTGERLYLDDYKYVGMKGKIETKPKVLGIFMKSLFT